MTTLARHRVVSPLLIADAPALRGLIDELAAELDAEASERGLLIVEKTCRLTGSVPMWDDVERTTWLRRLLRRPVLVERVMRVPAQAVLVEALVLPTTSRELPLTVQQIGADGTAAMAAAVLPHAGCEAGLILGTTDAGGYRNLRCPEHGEVWTRGG